MCFKIIANFENCLFSGCLSEISDRWMTYELIKLWGENYLLEKHDWI